MTCPGSHRNHGRDRTGTRDFDPFPRGCFAPWLGNRDWGSSNLLGRLGQIYITFLSLSAHLL